MAFKQQSCQWTFVHISFQRFPIYLRDQGTRIKMVDIVIPSLFVLLERPSCSLMKCLLENRVYEAKWTVFPSFCAFSMTFLILWTFDVLHLLYTTDLQRPSVERQMYVLEVQRGQGAHEENWRFANPRPTLKLLTLYQNLAENNSKSQLWVKWN